MSGDLQELQVYGMVMGPAQPKPLLLLKEKSGDLVFPVGLSPSEAHVLSVGSDRSDGPHGATLALFKQLHIQLAKAHFREMRGTRQIMELHFAVGIKPKVKVVETLAESGISLALATKAPLFATAQFIEQSRRTPFDLVSNPEFNAATMRGPNEIAH